ncbi:hypothetical protein FRB94_010242 [Tulasnella sp. JGI-2019a]|nr:hypothetical protein FRB94_010242 [Tulasnella sp. JGI-2019a]
MGADTLQNAKTSLQVLSTIIKAVPIPEPFKSAVVGIPDAVLQIISIVDTAKGNIEDAKVLVLYIATITDKTIRPLDLLRVTPATQNRILEFQEALQQITEEVSTIASRRSFRKWIVNYDRDASTLKALKQRVTDVITGIQLETAVATGHEVELLYQEQQVLIRKQQEADSGSSKEPPCMDGTRVSLLKSISQWIEAPPADTRRGLCIIGAAGRGKSSIGASVAQQERELKHLGADFYFTVDQQDRNEGEASTGDRDIVQRSLEVQFRKLIQVPLETLADDPDCPPLVILPDGLDECNNDYAFRLLDLIGQSFAKLPTVVKFIITSRPEPHLLHLYRVNPMDAELEVRSLDLEEVEEVEGDIEEFLKRKLPKMVWWVKDPSKWPGEVRRKALAKLCNGLWIFAVTVTRMLTDQHFRDPEKQLDALLSEASDLQRVYGRNSDLYAIYSKILNRACPPDSPPELLHLFLDVLGALCVVKRPVNIHTLATFLYPDPSNNASRTDEICTRVLGYLQAVLIVPDVDADVPSRDAEPIRFIHKSFEDYLTDTSICDTRFLVNIDEQHRRMAICCMRRMEDLQKPNICDVDPNVPTAWVGSGTFHDKAGVEVVVQQHISSALQYACENWATHVSDTSPDCDDVFASVDTFARTRLLY